MKVHFKTTARSLQIMNFKKPRKNIARSQPRNVKFQEGRKREVSHGYEN